MVESSLCVRGKEETLSDNRCLLWILMSRVGLQENIAFLSSYPLSHSLYQVLKNEVSIGLQPDSKT